MKELMIVIDILGVALLAISVILALKSETGKSLLQTICLYAGEALCVTGSILFLQLYFL